MKGRDREREKERVKGRETERESEREREIERVDGIFKREFVSSLCIQLQLRVREKGQWNLA